MNIPSKVIKELGWAKDDEIQYVVTEVRDTKESGLFLRKV